MKMNYREILKVATKPDLKPFDTFTKWGPFQGNVACMHIKLGSGVVGTAFEKKTSIIVPDVHEFAGHIACDANSKSELVVPLFKNSKIYGVIDIDSPSLDRFSSVEPEEVEELAVVLSEHV